MSYSERSYHIYYIPNKTFFIKTSSLINATDVFFQFPPNVHSAYLQVVEDNEAVYTLNDIKNLLKGIKIKSKSKFDNIWLVSDSTMQYLLNQKNDESLYRYINDFN